MTFLRNAWYVAGFSDDVGETPFARTLLNDPIVFFRDSTGTIAALQDRCPHRFVPLSQGKVDGDTIVCGYHGLKLATDGSCADTRFNAAICKSATVRSYPVLDRHGAIWIWMGEADQADESRIPPFEFLDDPARRVVKDTTYLKANYTLEIDNLLDLSHLDFLHRTTIGNGTLTTGKHSVSQEGRDVVHSNWDSPNVEMPSQYRAVYQTPDGKCDSWYDMRWQAPGLVRLDTGICDVGADRSDGISVLQGHFVTPETDDTAWYFWMVAIPDAGQPEAFWAGEHAFIKNAFENEDRPMLEVQQTTMKSNDFWAERPVIFPEDAGAVRARRLLDKLIRDEQPSTADDEPVQRDLAVA